MNRTLRRAGIPYFRNPLFDDTPYFGDIDKNQVFWKKDTAIAFWGRYLRDIEVFPPPEKYSYQDWIVGRK